MRRSCSKRRLKAAAPRRRRLRCVAFCAHVRYRDPSTVEANRADCNGRSPHMRTRVPPAIVRGARSNSWRSRFARFVRARGWGLGDGRRDASLRRICYPGARRPTFIRSEKKMNTGVSAGTAITTLTVVGPKPDRTKADPGANAKTRAVYYSLRPRWAGAGRGCTGRPERAYLRACLRATDARYRTANARAASCSAWGPCFACMGQQVIMVDGAGSCELLVLQLVFHSSLIILECLWSPPMERDMQIPQRRGRGRSRCAKP